MNTNALSELQPDATTAKRAQYEAFEFALESPGHIRVTNGSYGDESDDHTYTVAVDNGVPTSCECPADTYGSGACKHRVAVAIRAPVLEAATGSQRDVATDGGEVLETNQNGEERPDDCECLPTFNPEGLGCFPCWQAGFETANPTATKS